MSETTRKRGFLSRIFGRDKTAEADAAEVLSEVGAQPPVEQTSRDGVETGHDAADRHGVADHRGDGVLHDAVVDMAVEPTEPLKDVAVDGTLVPPTPAAGAETLAALAHSDVEPDHDLAPRPAPDPEPPRRGGWLQRLKAGLSRTSSKLSDGITGLFTKRKLDAETLDDLEDLLIQADLGVAMATRIRGRLSTERLDKSISPEEVRQVLAAEVAAVLAPVARPLPDPGSARPHVMLIVGVNGTGKTTTIGKLAHRYRAQGKTVMLAAGDTFRAAAIEQLKIWGERTKSPVVAGKTGADSSGLAFEALQTARAEGVDVLLIDTAGRLQNKAALMQELEKVVRDIKKLDPDAPHDVVLVLDATTGQNALNQVDVFKDKVGVTGLVMTKLDGTARGGILVAIAERFAIPVYAIGIGEGIDDLQPFDPDEFARAIAQVEA